MKKPVLFIGSSTESLPVVTEYEQELQEVAKIERWDKWDVFRPGEYTLDGLKRATEEVDFALFIVGQDDETKSRDEVVPSPRDNVIFEAGFFTPVLGLQRVFYSVDSSGSKMPSDWEGLGHTEHDSSAKGRDMIVKGSYEIGRTIGRLGGRSRPSQLWLTESEMVFLRGISGPWVDFITSEGADRSVVGRFEIRLCREGVSIVDGTAWNPDGAPQARFRSQSLRIEPPRLFYSWRGEHPRTAEHTGYFGAGEIQFDPPIEQADQAESGRGKFSVTSEKRPEETLLLRRVLRRPTAEEDADLTSDKPERVGGAVKQLLHRLETIF